MDIQPVSLSYQLVYERDVLHGSQYWLHELTYAHPGTFYMCPGKFQKQGFINKVSGRIVYIVDHVIILSNPRLYDMLCFRLSFRFPQGF